ncbi:hypothetical protein [Tardiphaga sp.]|uniref:hypothetical protein n=1 Tax=Tardiphaga sp. TaxID=1926292 RepID=UPI00261134FD|nr:hypothetical protein [Tardiphaga sp.]MDB5617461.1 hypothetical protein [Tardiphaga sp.]
MSDDELKKMLDAALNQVASRDSTENAAKKKLEADMKASGVQLKERVLPRLRAAQEAWKGKLKLDIVDDSAKFAAGANGRTTNPSITATAVGVEPAGFVFVTHYPGHASIQVGAGLNRGSQAHDFRISKIDDLTDGLIDQVLQSILDIALGLKKRH